MVGHSAPQGRYGVCVTCCCTASACIHGHAHLRLSLTGLQQAVDSVLHLLSQLVGGLGNSPGMVQLCPGGWTARVGRMPHRCGRHIPAAARRSFAPSSRTCLQGTCSQTGCWTHVCLGSEQTCARPGRWLLFCAPAECTSLAAGQVAVGQAHSLGSIICWQVCFGPQSRVLAASPLHWPPLWWLTCACRACSLSDAPAGRCCGHAGDT